MWQALLERLEQFGALSTKSEGRFLRNSLDDGWSVYEAHAQLYIRRWLDSVCPHRSRSI